MGSGSLENQVALVTGGSRSIGASIARRLAAEGAAVVITYSRSKAEAEVLVASIVSDGGRASAVEADAGNPEAARASVAFTIETFGRIDILVNNAGILIKEDVEKFSFEDYQRMIAVNVTGVFVATQEAARRMTRGGRIIDIGSTMSRYAGFATCSVYTLTKGAIAGFNRGLVRDLGPKGITVNTLLVGPIKTDLTSRADSLTAQAASSIALGRYGEPIDVAAAVAFLASPQGAFITGAELVVDGGYTA